MPDDIEVFIEFAPGLKRVGTLHRYQRQEREARQNLPSHTPIRIQVIEI